MATANLYALTDTWNAASTHDAIKMNVTNTSSNADSQLINLQTGGTQRFGVRAPHIANGSDTTPFLNLVDVWNTSGAAVGIRYNTTDTNSAAGALLMDLQVGGTSYFQVKKDGSLIAGRTSSGGILQLGLTPATILDRNGNNTLLNAAGTNVFAVTTSLDACLRSDGFLSWSSTTSPIGTRDLYLARDAANTLALRNSTNAQTLRVYNTYTDASNYERLSIDWSTNDIFIRTQAAGTGSARAMYIGTEGSQGLTFRSNATNRWTVNSSGHFTAAADNTYDIGGSGALRPRNIYVAGFVNSTTYKFGAGGSIINQSDGVFAWFDNAGTSFGRLQFGGTTSSFPALKRSATSILVRLADDSADAPLSAKTILTPMTGELTIATGAITVTGGYHRIDTESDGASDDLDTINGGADGARLVLRAEHTDRSVVVKDGTGNIQIAGDCTLDNTQDTIELIYDGTLTAWLELARSNSGA